MKLPRNFQFVHIADAVSHPHLIYTAKLLAPGDHTYLISWDDKDDKGHTHYDRPHAENFVKQGTWIVKTIDKDTIKNSDCTHFLRKELV